MPTPDMTYPIYTVTVELRARGMPLGIMPGMSYEEGEVSLAEGNCVLFHSDGLVEAHNPRGEMFGFPRLRALVAEHGEERSLGNLLLEELYSFVGEGWEQEDDITLLEEDLRRNFSKDIVVLINRGTFHGHERYRQLAQMLGEELPE